jgi:dTDP-4-dehydrorhamnose 3,5-epimerase
LQPDTIIAYRVDAPYAPACDAGIFWNDPAIAIDWPFDTARAVLSAKDEALPRLAGIASPFTFERDDVVEPVQRRAAVPRPA